MTQKQLADAADLHPNTVARLERGEHEPTWPLVLKLSTVLGVACTAFADAGERPEANPPAGPAPAEPESPRRRGKK